MCKLKVYNLVTSGAVSIAISGDYRRVFDTIATSSALLVRNALAVIGPHEHFLQIQLLLYNYVIYYVPISFMTDVYIQ